LIVRNMAHGLTVGLFYFNHMRLTETELINRFARAIARHEGFFDRKKIQTVAQRTNNPGCLLHWKDTAGNPLPTVNGFVQFATEDDGWRALRAQCRINIKKRQLTFLEFFAGRPGMYRGFSPATERGLAADMRKSDPVQYARDVLAAVAGPEAGQFTVSTRISDLMGAGVEERFTRQLAA
jgi:hypothetical protein